MRRIPSSKCPFSPGDRVGTYEILSTLGAGGMGVVYRARDGKLGREVAIKTLPEEVAADGERLARFEREARALAALNHVNVASIYGFEQADSAHLLVMELVEGETLADWIARGPIPVERALPLFLQIAAGLEAAHAKGIIHRDLKPANIKIAQSGSTGSREIKPGAVKILDFGLAKALTPEAPAQAVGASHSPTLTLQATMRGELLGTAAYMSPEQVEGVPADERADIWAFGVCLLESLTGRAVFRGTSASQVLASVLRDEPDLDALPAATSPLVRRLLRRCLEKNRDRRLHDIADARLDIEEAIVVPAAEAASAAAPAHRKPRWWNAIMATALLAIGAAVAVLVERSLHEAPVPLPAARFVLNPPPNAVVDPLMLQVAITADGSTVVYAARGQGLPALFARRIEELEGAPIPMEDSAYSPFLSPDERWIGYVHVDWASATVTTLRKAPIGGGPSVELAKGNIITGASWGPDDTIVFGQRGPLRRVAAAGGEAHDVTVLGQGEIAHRHPEFLPGGRAVLFAAYTGTGLDDATIEALTLATGERKVLVRGGSTPRYARSGHLVYAVGSTLRAAAFDPERLELRGEPVPVQENVSRTVGGFANYAVSASGALAYVHSGTAARNVLVWVDREGREEPLGAPPRPYGIPRLSPDGTRIALAFDPVEDIWIWELERETMTRLDVSPGIDDSPVWSPDGRTVFHSSELASGGWEIVARNADGSGDPVRISEHRAFLRPLTVTADGAGLVTLRAVSRYPPYDVVLLDIAGKAEPKVLLDEDWSFFSAELSPDGRFLAYTSNESGSDEVFVSPFPRLDSHRWQVSSGGGSWPRWSPDGTEIFFLDDRDYLTAVPVTTREGTLEFGRSKVLFETAYYSSWFGRPYDVSPDGRRFLMIKVPAADGELSGRIVYVQNWFDELRRLAPARR